MMEFLKHIGYGVFYTLLSPFYIAFFLLNMLYGVLVYLFMEASSIVMFFLGKSYTGDDYETSLLKQRKEEYKTQTRFRGSNYSRREGDDYER